MQITDMELDRIRRDRDRNRSEHEARGEENPDHQNTGPKYLSVCHVGNFCFNHRRSSVVWPEEIETCAQEPQAARSIMRCTPRLAVMVATLVSLTAEAAAERTKVAVFDFELVDTSLEGAVNGPRADEAARLARLAVELRNRLAASGRYAPLDISPVAGEAKASNLRACGACDRKLAQQLGAELAITGMVH